MRQVWIIAGLWLGAGACVPVKSQSSEGFESLSRDTPIARGVPNVREPRGLALTEILSQGRNEIQPRRVSTQGLTLRIRQIDAARYPTVTLALNLVDSDGRAVPFDPADLEVLENGERIPPEHFIGGVSALELGSMADRIPMSPKYPSKFLKMSPTARRQLPPGPHPGFAI